MSSKSAQQKFATIAARVPASLKQRLEAAAKVERRSASNMLRIILDEYLPPANVSKETK